MRIFPQRFWQGIFLILKDIYILSAFTGAVFCFVSLWSFSIFDNSLNTASADLTKNWLGLLGAYTSDILWQLFGYFSYAIPIIVVMACVQIILRHFQRTWMPSKKILITGLVLLMISLTYYQHLIPVSFRPFGGALSVLGLKVIERFLNILVAKEWIEEVIFVMFLCGCICFLFGFGITYEQIKRLYYWISGKSQKTKHCLTNTSDHFLNNSWFKTSEEEGLAVAHDDLSKIILENTELEMPPINHAVKKVKKLDPVKTSGEYVLPSFDLLEDTYQKKVIVDNAELQEQAQHLKIVLEEFGIKGEITNIRPGPIVTTFELKPAAGIKVARVIGLADDIARSMSAISARIATVPGQNVIGIELPNKRRQMVYMRDLLLHDDFSKTNALLPLILGQDIVGKPIIADLAKMPHLLVAGTTGSGKSVSINTMILSILFKLSPESCRFIMIDPKMLELSVYNDIPQLLTPVVTEPKKAIVALKWAVKEMENRYRNMSQLGVRNIEGYNARLKQARHADEVLARRVQTGFDPDTGQAIFENQVLDLKPLPYIVVVIDEMADLMLVAGKEVEAAVQRLAQMARAAGIHLIMATQRPSVDVITGTIKANFPTRISFQVTSKIDSRTILGEQGAEQLLGHGDMLYMSGGGRLLRVHGPFIKDTEVESVVHFLKEQGSPLYVNDVTTDLEGLFSENSSNTDEGGDPLFNQVVELIKVEKKISTSFIQRHFQIGYNRAARIVDFMEKKGIISEPNHQGKREILI